MSVLFWITTILAILISFYKLFYRKDSFSACIFLLFGFYLPLCMSFLPWITVITERKFTFYYVLICFNLIYIIVCASSVGRLVPIKELCANNAVTFKIRKKIPFFKPEILNILYILFVLVSNFKTSGSFFPLLTGVDIHLEELGAGGSFQQILFFMTIINLFEYLYCREKRYIIWALVCFIIYPATNGGRSMAMFSFFCVIAFLLYFTLKGDVFRKNKKLIFMLALLLSGTIYAFIAIFEKIRFADVDVNDVVNKISFYCGPDNALLRYYYWYFPANFDSLNFSIEQISFSHNYIGLSTFEFFYDGILRLHNLGIYKTDWWLNILRPYYRGALMTQTILINFWMDFGYLCFIPMVLMALGYSYMRKKIKRQRPTLFAISVYFLFVPFLMSITFINQIFGMVMLYQLILLFIFTKFVYVIEYQVKDIV